MILLLGIQRLFMNKELHIHINDIRIRDPFIVPETSTKSYYMFGTTDSEPWFGDGEGFLVYQSKDLIFWDCLGYGFQPEGDFWGKKNFWAPEVHCYQGSYYLFGSFYSEEMGRGVQILKSDQITGPYHMMKNEPITPKDWECLDGTLYVDDNEEPWIVFSHEWTQIQDGAICCCKLSKDLMELLTEPVVLFHASEAPWCVPNTGDVIQKDGLNYVTDGPYLYKNAQGQLQMLWSSFSDTGYSIGVATSTSGKITGPWKQADLPFFKEDGGHGMIFKTHEGQLKLSIHTPNESPIERARFFDIVEDEKIGLRISGK